jgi:hypothetical protein
MRFDIELIIKELNQMASEGIVDAYALGGAVAANIYVESATTEDVDVFVIFKPGSSIIIDPTPVLNYFKDKGYKESDDRIIIGGWPVQFLPPPGHLEEEAIQNAITLEDDDEPPLRVFTPEYLDAVALKTGLPKDFARLLQFWESPALDRGEFEEIVSRHGLAEKWVTFKQKFEITEP